MIRFIYNKKKRKEGIFLMKKHFSMLVALVMLVTTLLPSFSVNAAFSDVSDNNTYKKAITTLSTLSVINGYDDGTFQPDKEISRAEFTKMIVYMLGLDNLKTTITSFNDVSIDHWANANIKTAYDLGIINGFDEVTFMPDAPVTYEQALKMLVCTLGYQAFAEQIGGYPTGYTKQAETIGLTDKISGTAYSQNASRGAIAQMMYNALEIDKYELDGISWKSSGKTLLNDYLNVKSIKGVIVGVDDSTTAECSSKLAKGELAIDDSITGQEYVIIYSEYGMSFSEMSKNLGRTVQIYYRSDKTSNDKWLVEMSTDMYKNEEVTVLSDQIDSFSGTTLKYYQDGSSKLSSLRINSSELTVRYNGRAVTTDVTLGGESYTIAEALEAWLDPDSEHFISGTAKFISNTQSGSYNVVDIYDYDTIVALRAPTTSDYRITDKTVTGKTITLDPDSSDYTFNITKNGNEITPTQIAANDVVNYALSLDGTYYTVLVTSSSVNGKITGTNLQASPKTITIDNKTYPVTDRFITYIRTKEQRDIAPGQQITAYKDAFGYLEWGTVNSSTSYYPYAYVIDAFNEADDYYLRLFAPTNTSITSLTSSTSYKVKTFKIASNSKLNGSKKSGEGIVEALADSQDMTDIDADEDTNYTGYNQFIRVGFNSAGEIENVVTCSNPGTQNSDSGRLVKYSALSDNKYEVSRTSVKIGGSAYAITSSTPLFVIPADRTDTDGYMLKPAVTDSTMRSGRSYYVEGFDVNSSMQATFLALYANDEMVSGTPITYSTKHSLVAEEIEPGYDEATTDVVDILKTYNASSTLVTSMISDDGEDFSGIHMGDIILYGKDSDGYADKFIVELSYSDIKDVLDAEGTTYDWTDSCFTSIYPGPRVNRVCADMYNVIRITDGNTIHVTKDGFDSDGVINSSHFETINIGNAVIIRYDADEDEFTTYAEGTTTALKVGDLKGADDFGLGCSKIAILSFYAASAEIPTVNMVVIYE